MGTVTVTDRDFERFFTLRNLPPPPATLLDVGPGGAGGLSYLLGRGHKVYAIDLVQHTGYPCRFILGDIRKTDFSDGFFDVVTAISTIEHIGLPGRFDVTDDDPEGDVKAVAEIRRILKQEGLLLMTLPFGVRENWGSFCRVYDAERLRALTVGFRVELEEYYCSDGGSITVQWRMCCREEAEGRRQYHALICLKLRKEG